MQEIDGEREKKMRVRKKDSETCIGDRSRERERCSRKMRKLLSLPTTKQEGESV